MTTSNRQYLLDLIKLATLWCFAALLGWYSIPAYAHWLVWMDHQFASGWRLP